MATSGSALYTLQASHEATHGASQAGREGGMQAGTTVVVGAIRHRSKTLS